MTEHLKNKVQAHSLVDAIVERLNAAIVTGELPPGSKLSEQALAATLGVSRGPLREAIRRLEGRKLVERKQNIGVHVVALKPKDLSDLLVVREALEGTACALAATNMEDDEIASLEELLRQHERQKSVQLGTGYYQESHDFDFHFRIAAASKNTRLISMLCEDLYDLLRVYRFKSSKLDGRAKTAMSEHRAIVAALKKRDPALAEMKMRQHIQNARLHIEAQVNSLPKGAAADESPEASRIIRVASAPLAGAVRRLRVP